jgi:putative transposase
VVLDWASRKVLAHRISISLDTGFCVEALEEAFSRYGLPDIVNTDQGAQFTSAAFIEALTSRHIRITSERKCLCPEAPSGTGDP